MKLLDLLRGLRLPILNIFLSRFLPGEWIMIGTYLTTWIFPEKMMILDKNIVTGLSWGMFFQFLFSHAGVGLGVAGNFSKKRSVIYTAVTGFGLFYLIFFAAFAYTTKSFMIILIFILILYQNLPLRNSSADQRSGDRLISIILIPFFSAMILLISSLSLLIPVPKLGFAQELGLDSTQFEVRGESGHPESIMFWGIVYYIMMLVFKEIWNRSQKRFAEGPDKEEGTC